MTSGGPLLFCPQCGKHNRCRSVPLRLAVDLNTELKKSRNIYFKSHSDIQWYRRTRQCSACSGVFVTAEVDEKFLNELVELRGRLLAKREVAVNAIRKANPWIERPENIPEDVAKDFLRSSCWWLTHSSGTPVRAPGHADRVYLDQRHGWAVDFGANTFLVGKAVERSAKKLKAFLDATASGKEPQIDQLKHDLRHAIAGAVANNAGNEYAGYYPINGDGLTFGAQEIDLNDAVSYLVRRVDVERLLKEPPL